MDIIQIHPIISLQTFLDCLALKRTQKYLLTSGILLQSSLILLPSIQRNCSVPSGFCQFFVTGSSSNGDILV